MKNITSKILSFFFVILIVVPLNSNKAQGKIEKWLNIGSFHNWYSSIGGEREVDHPAATGQLWGW